MNEIVKVTNLTKKYKELIAVDDLSFSIKKGEILGLLGPNGSGKTTTINALLSLINYDSGNVEIFGSHMNPDSYDIKRKIGVVFQEVAVFDELTVRENIDYFCGLYIADKRERENLVLEAIDLVGLSEFASFRPKQLSGGLLRRLNIACGIAHKPSLIFLDEPTVAVDPQSRNNILEGIKTLNKNGATIVYTSHYMEEVEALCSNIIILDKGRVIASGSKEELKKIVDISLKVTIEISGLSDKNIKYINGLSNIDDVVYHDGILNVSYKNGSSNLTDLLSYFQENKLMYSKIFSELPTLNDVFLELTGKELRD